MSQAVPGGTQFRVLVRGATARDDAMTVRELGRAGIAAHACATAADMLAQLPSGAGALLLAEECLLDASATGLLQAVVRQPPWSDLPVMILARHGAESRVIAGGHSLLPMMKLRLANLEYVIDINDLHDELGYVRVGVDEVRIGDVRVALAQPQTYMNDSGIAVVTEPVASRPPTTSSGTRWRTSSPRRRRPPPARTPAPLPAAAPRCSCAPRPTATRC